MAQSVSGTAHDFSSQGWSGGDTCAVCHTPHSALNVDAPAWNHALSTQTFEMYSSPTIDMVIAAAPQGVSLACLSCHDGATAIDSYGVKSGSTLMTGNAVIGIDLQGNHPISITYDSTADAGFNGAATLTGAGLQLYGDNSNQVECATCHNPHDGTSSSFLRVDDTGSALCTVCHI
jgi:predicted CXXCH cytochrome family protein